MNSEIDGLLLDWQEHAEYEIPDYILEDVKTLLLALRDKMIGLLPAPKEVDETTLEDEFLASAYESQAEAWFAGWDKYHEEALKKL